MLTFKLHADVETLLESAVGAALPLRLVDDAGAVGHARVHLLVLHGALEEALARLARQQAVVVPAHLGCYLVTLYIGGIFVFDN